MIILKGKSAERFRKNINNGEISKKQQDFLDDCVKLVDSCEISKAKE